MKYQTPTPAVIKTARTRVGLSVNKVCHMLDINRHSWWRYESGKTAIPIHTWWSFLVMTGQYYLKHENIGYATIHEDIIQ